MGKLRRRKKIQNHTVMTSKERQRKGKAEVEKRGLRGKRDWAVLLKQT